MDIYLMHRCTQRAESVQALDVDLPAVRLTGHGVTFLEACHFRHQIVQLLHLLAVSCKDINILKRVNFFYHKKL